MNTPNNKAGWLTEKIMMAFYGYGIDSVVELSTAEYNRVYEHVYAILSKFGNGAREELQASDKGDDLNRTRELLRVIALEELLADCAKDIPHDKERTVTPPPTKQAIFWKCKPNCRRCRIDAALKSWEQ